MTWELTDIEPPYELEDRCEYCGDTAAGECTCGRLTCDKHGQAEVHPYFPKEWYCDGCVKEAENGD